MESLYQSTQNPHMIHTSPPRTSARRSPVASQVQSTIEGKQGWPFRPPLLASTFDPPTSPLEALWPCYRRKCGNIISVDISSTYCQLVVGDPT